MGEYFQIKIIFKSYEHLVLDCLPSWRIRNLKWKIQEVAKIEPNDQRLFFEGMLLDNDYTLSNYGIEPQPQKQIAQTSSAFQPPAEPINFEIYLLQAFTGIPQTYFLDEVHYDRKWNCSFENLNCHSSTHDPNDKYTTVQYEKKQHFRGGHQYVRPVGCVRYGVKVTGKYDNDDWLGGKGYRTDTEWPVAYHGTKELNVLEILRHGFLLEKGVRFAYGKGIYCTPDPLVALGYAYNYEFNGCQYKLIIQCRVDPKRLQIVHGKSWKGAYWLVPDGTAIRPYGICVFPDKYANKLATNSLMGLTMNQQQPQQQINPGSSTSSSAVVPAQQSQQQQQLSAAFANYVRYSQPYKSFQQQKEQQQQQQNVQAIVQQQKQQIQAIFQQQQQQQQSQKQDLPDVEQQKRQTAKKSHMPINSNAVEQQNMPSTSSNYTYRIVLTPQQDSNGSLLDSRNTGSSDSDTNIDVTNKNTGNNWLD